MVLTGRRSYTATLKTCPLKALENGARQGLQVPSFLMMQPGGESGYDVNAPRAIHLRSTLVMPFIRTGSVVSLVELRGLTSSAQHAVSILSCSMTAFTATTR